MRATGKRRRWWWWKWGNAVALTEMTFSIKLTKPVSLLLSHSLPILLFEPCVRVLTHHRADTHFGQRAHGPRPNDALAGAPRTCGKVLMLMRSPGTRAAADMPACGARCVHWCSETRGAKAADGAAAAATSAAAKTGECIDLWQRMRTRSELGPTEERRQRIEWGLCSPARHHRQCTHRTTRHHTVLTLALITSAPFVRKLVMPEWDHPKLLHYVGGCALRVTAPAIFLSSLTVRSSASECPCPRSPLFEFGRFHTCFVTTQVVRWSRSLSLCLR
jgi:hypothetical protein